jgi:hypothetical protein
MTMEVKVSPVAGDIMDSVESNGVPRSAGYGFIERYQAAKRDSPSCIVILGA